MLANTCCSGGSVPGRRSKCHRPAGTLSAMGKLRTSILDYPAEMVHHLFRAKWRLEHIQGRPALPFRARRP
jgi:hypothetical protein